MNNFNLVLRTYIAMRQMTADDLALLGTLRALNDTDREKLIQAMSDKPAKKPTKKPAGKGGGGKSARASGMAEQLNEQLGGRRQEQTEPIIADDSERCQFMSPAGGHCGGTRDDNKHHLHTRADYHQFVAPSATRAATGD